MKTKKIWLGMLAMVLTFGMTVVGCGDGDGDEGIQEEPPRYYGVLNRSWKSPTALTQEERSYVNQYSDLNDDTSFLLNKANYASLQRNEMYYGVKVDDAWLKQSDLFDFPRTSLYFYTDWRMTKTERDTDSYDSKTSVFEVIDATSVKIGGQKYKYEVSVSNTRNLDYSYTTSYGSTFHEKGTFKMYILKIWFDGDDAAPKIFLSGDIRITSAP